MCRGIGFFFAADFALAALVKLPKSVSPEDRMHLVTTMNETTLDGHFYYVELPSSGPVSRRYDDQVSALA